MKNNTKIRLHLSKQLFESLTKQVIAEAKSDMSGGAYTEAVKTPKVKHDKAPKAHKAEEKPVKEMETKVAEEKNEMNEAAIPPELMQSLGDVIDFLKDNAGYLATIGGITGLSKLIASQVNKDPETRKALDAATGAGSMDVGAFGGKALGGGKKEVK